MVGGIDQICLTPRNNLPAKAKIERFVREVAVQLLHIDAVTVVIREIGPQFQ
jgi:hypothetical protein